jgi:hypothetical protein
MDIQLKITQMKPSKNFFRTFLCCSVFIFILLISCTANHSTPSPVPVLLTSLSFTPLPSKTLTPPLPTATPPPMPTVRPTLAVYPGPARLYLPQLADFPDIYETDSNNASDNVLRYAALPVTPENIAVVSFRSKGGGLSTGRQNGIYLRFVYWVIVAPDAATAQVFYSMANQPDWQKKAFLVVLPAEVEAPVTNLAPLPAGQLPCQDSDILSISQDPYAAYRSGPLPTADPKVLQPMDPKVLASLSPDLYLFAPCRVQNLLVLFWGYTANNYDGKMTPLPTDVLVGQVSQFLKVVTSKVMAQGVNSQ